MRRPPAKPAQRTHRAEGTMSFSSRLKNIAQGMDYFALPIPEAITRRPGTHGAGAQVRRSMSPVSHRQPLSGGPRMSDYLRVRTPSASRFASRPGIAFGW